MASRLVCSAALILGLSAPLAAQTAPQATATAARPQPAAEPEERAVDVTRLPVNISRLQRQLQRSAIRDESVGLNLRYIVDVFGQAPPIVFLPPDSNLEFGPVPYGAPTHAELLKHITPQEYRAPAGNFGDVFRWLADKAR